MSSINSRIEDRGTSFGSSVEIGAACSSACFEWEDWESFNNNMLLVGTTNRRIKIFDRTSSILLYPSLSEVILFSSRFLVVSSSSFFFFFSSSLASVICPIYSCSYLAAATFIRSTILSCFDAALTLATTLTFDADLMVDLFILTGL
ncbi:hypothetical protein L1887_36171 [Cichorium endivia]|nr:hypothetical protein L1887_36171 [Cichorium endivia]